MSTFHYGIDEAKNKREAIQELTDNCEYLNEKLEKLSEQVEAACNLLGIAFSAGCWGEAHYTVKKEGDKK